MKQVSILASLALLFSVTTGVAQSDLSALDKATKDYKLTILHVNDEHSRLEPVNKYNSTCSAADDKEGKCFGGIARMKTLIDERRMELKDEGYNVLMLNAGDEFQGSLFYTTYRGQVAVQFLNELGIDAMAVGNHEFDNGPENLEKFVKKATFPIISGNTSFYFEKLLKDLIPGYVILEKGGEKIAVIGLLAPDTKVTSSPGDNIAFVDEVNYLTSVIPEIKAKNVNKIIVLSHVGLNRDKEIAAAVDDIDVIVGGHSHSLLTNTMKGGVGPYPIVVKNPSGKEVPIVHAGAYSKYLGELSIVFDAEGNVKSASGEPHLLDKTVAPNPEFVKQLKEFAKPIEELKAKRIGATALPIDGSREKCRAVECAMGDLVADAMLDRVNNQGITIAIQNGGGVRASIDAGDITMGEVLTVLPFQNSLATFQMSGANIIAALENGVSEVEDGAGRFPQVAGLRVYWDRKGEAGVNRIKRVEVKDGDDWKPIDEQATYGVVSNDYLRKGGDGYEVFKTDAKNAYDYGPGLEEAVADYIEKNSPVVVKLDGRIVECDQYDDKGMPAERCVKAAMEGKSASMQPETGEMKDGELKPGEVKAANEAVKEEMKEAGLPESDGMTAEKSSASSGEDMGASDRIARGKYTIRKGDTYWSIAERAYGDGSKWKKIRRANRKARRAHRLKVDSTTTIP